MMQKGRNCGASSVRSGNECLVLPSELIRSFGHRKEIRVHSLSRKVNAQNISTRISFQWPNTFFNSVDKTKHL